MPRIDGKEHKNNLELSGEETGKRQKTVELGRDVRKCRNRGRSGELDNEKE